MDNPSVTNAVVTAGVPSEAAAPASGPAAAEDMVVHSSAEPVLSADAPAGKHMEDADAAGATGPAATKFDPLEGV
jgi:hypothetical protein